MRGFHKLFFWQMCVLSSDFLHAIHCPSVCMNMDHLSLLKKNLAGGQVQVVSVSAEP